MLDLSWEKLVVLVLFINDPSSVFYCFEWYILSGILVRFLCIYCWVDAGLLCHGTFFSLLHMCWPMQYHTSSLWGEVQLWTLSCSWMFWICHVMDWVWVYSLYGKLLIMSRWFWLLCPDGDVQHACGPCRYVDKVYTYKPSTSVGHPKLIAFSVVCSYGVTGDI